MLKTCSTANGYCVKDDGKECYKRINARQKRELPQILRRDDVIDSADELKRPSMRRLWPNWCTIVLYGAFVYATCLDRPTQTSFVCHGSLSESSQHLAYSMCVAQQLLQVCFQVTDISL